MFGCCCCCSNQEFVLWGSERHVQVGRQRRTLPPDSSTGHVLLKVHLKSAGSTSKNIHYRVCLDGDLEADLVVHMEAVGHAWGGGCYTVPL